ncbi:MAG: TRAP transporter small permease [Gammaproteobacteria bacterium]|nr:MAG: TRAP transporter small permease [Gammaproteobacteria bacterium]
MSAASSVLTDHTNLSRADRLFFKLETGLNLMSGLIIFALVLFATVNILGRWLFDRPLNGYVDWVEQAMAFIAFLGLSYTQRLGGHIRMDILIGRLKGRALWSVELLNTVLMLLITLVLIYGTSLHFWRAWSLGDSSLDIQLPTWPAKLVVPVAFTVLALRLILQIWGYGRALMTGTETPVAVPLIESTATAAQREASSVETSGESDS